MEKYGAGSIKNQNSKTRASQEGEDGKRVGAWNYVQFL